MPKKYLSQEIINKYIDKSSKSKHFIRNPEKRELFKEIINSNFLKGKRNESRIKSFQRIWRKSQRVSRIIYGKTKDISQRSKISANFAREYTYYRSSFLSNFRFSKNVDIKESVRTAEFKTYEERIKNFLKKYGDSKIEETIIEGFSNLTLNDYFEMFKNGDIDKETMNEIISFFKTGIDYYKGQVGSD